MLRQLLLYLSQAEWAHNAATNWPLTQRVARRFVAGESLAAAIATTRRINEQGLLVTLNFLGESVTSEQDTRQVVEEYRRLLDAIHENQLQASVSIKPTHLGLDIGTELCLNNLRQILTLARQHSIAITIDMEGSPHLDATLLLYRTLRDEYDFDNTGTVIQSYLYRSEEDMRQLAAENSHIRLVKGAYLEPPEIAFADKATVNTNFVKLARLFLTESNSSYLCVATHDEAMIQAVQAIIRENNIPPDRYEYQMLLGIRSDRQRELAAAGETVRVYVPYGEAWYPYFVRRLAERPANLWFFLRALVGR